MMAAPASIPTVGADPVAGLGFVTAVHPYGANGSQLAGFTKNAPTRMTNTTAPSLIATMTALAVALSLIPRVRMPVRARTNSTAGRLMTDVVVPNDQDFGS